MDEKVYRKSDIEEALLSTANLFEDIGEILYWADNSEGANLVISAGMMFERGLRAKLKLDERQLWQDKN